MNGSTQLQENPFQKCSYSGQRRQMVSEAGEGSHLHQLRKNNITETVSDFTFLNLDHIYVINLLETLYIFHCWLWCYMFTQQSNHNRSLEETQCSFHAGVVADAVIFTFQWRTCKQTLPSRALKQSHVHSIFVKCEKRVSADTRHGVRYLLCFISQALIKFKKGKQLVDVCNCYCSELYMHKCRKTIDCSLQKVDVGFHTDARCFHQTFTLRPGF